MIAAQSAHRQNSMINEKQNLKKIAKRELATSNKNDSITKFDSTDIELNQTSHEVRISEKSHVFFEILDKSEEEISNEYRT